MAKQVIDLVQLDVGYMRTRDGDLLSEAMDKINANFDEVYDGSLVDTDTIERDLSTPGEVGLRVVDGVFAELTGDNVFDGSVAFTGIVVSTIAVKTDNYNPTGLASARRIRWNGAASTGLTGIAAQVDGFQLTITNQSTDYLLWLDHESASSTAANRFDLRGFPAFLFPGDSITIEYNATLAAPRWQVVAWPAQGQRAGFTEFHDLIHEPAPATIASGTGALGSTQAASNWTTLKAHGAYAVVLGTTNTGYGVMGSFNTANVIPSHGPILFMASVNPLTALPDGTETYDFYVGVHDLYDGTVDNAMAWNLRWNGSASEWSQLVMAAGSATRSTTNSPSTTAANTTVVGVYVNSAATRVDFLYSTDNKSFNLAGSASSGLPAVSTSGTMSLAAGGKKSAGTTSRSIYLDWFGSRIDSVRA